MTLIPIIMPMPASYSGGAAGLDVQHRLDLPTPEGHEWRVSYQPINLIKKAELVLWRGTYPQADLVFIVSARLTPRAMERAARRAVNKYVRHLRQFAKESE